MNLTHTTTPSESGTAHMWTLGDERGSLTLSVLRTRSPRVAEYAAVSAAFASVVTVTDGGAWVFDVIQTHTPDADAAWGCLHHLACETDAVVGQFAGPAWQRIVGKGVTDKAVLTELEALHGDIFEDAA